MANTPDTSNETVERFLQLDRHSGLGRLAGGVVHALNNSLAVAFGQVDLMMINPATQEFKEEFETILGSFEEGSRLTGSLMLVTNSMQDGSEDVGQVFMSLIGILSRIHKRDQIKVTSDLDPDLRPAKNIDRLCHVMFHAISLGLKLARTAPAGERILACRLMTQENKVRLEVSVGNRTFPPPASDILASICPPNADNVQYHIWIIDKICAGGGSWKISKDEKLLCIDW
ncbi:MAG: hypothetical protein V2A61_06510 [Calditrichota bacterium]